MQVSGLGWCPWFGFTLGLLGWKLLPSEPRSWHSQLSHSSHAPTFAERAQLFSFTGSRGKHCSSDKCLWPYRHWWELQRGFWITFPGCSPKSPVMNVGSSGAPLSPCGCLPALAWECLPVPLYEAAFQRGSSLFEWQGAGKQHLFVSFSDNGKYISLHPFLGIALRQTKSSFSSPWRRTGAGSAGRRGCPEAGHLGLGPLCSRPQGWQLFLHASSSPAADAKHLLLWSWWVSICSWFTCSIWFCTGFLRQPGALGRGFYPLTVLLNNGLGFFSLL